MNKHMEHPRASALVMVLIFITFVSVLILGFLVAMRFEGMAARSHLNGTQAELFVQTGIEAGLSRLLDGLDAAPASRFAVSGPGWLYVADQAFQGAYRELHSGFAPGGSSGDEAAWINQKTPGAAVNPVAYADSPMRVRWVYVLQDGTWTTNAPPPYDPQNPAIGRFAFWIDDESTKINVNTAWTKEASNTVALSNPSRVALEAIFPEEAGTIADYRKNSGWFQSPSDWRAVSADVAQAGRPHAFDLTHYSHSPDVNVFGEERIVLTTQKSRAGDAPFFDILIVPDTDPGVLANLDAGKVRALVEKLAAILRRDDWPILPGASFAAKYSPVRPEQLALNLIEYVRAAETPVPLVEPIRGEVSGATFTMNEINSHNGMMGNVRGVKITEVGFHLENGSVPGKYGLRIIVELHLPERCGLEEVDLRELSVHYFLTSYGEIWRDNTWNDPSVFGARKIDGVEAVVEGSPILGKGEYRKVTVLHGREIEFPAPHKAADLVAIFPTVGLAKTGSQVRLDNVNLWRYDVLSSGLLGPDSAINSMASNDPYNRSRTNWPIAPVPPSQVTWGGPNVSSSTLGGSGAGSPQQDTDAAGFITDAGLAFPPPKGSPGNESGVVQSVAELGHVHTGFESRRGAASVLSDGPPWRTLILQPQASAAHLPDWLLLDIFRVSRPASFPESVGKQAGGRVNINGNILPFTDSEDQPSVQRLLPLQALLLGARKNDVDVVDEAQAESLAKNIIAHKPASGSVNQGRDWGLPALYLTSGQLAEVEGIADQGESSERLLREIIDLATTRSGAFTIHAVGQSLRQSGEGLRVLAESRASSLVEFRKAEVSAARRTVLFIRH